MLVIVSGNVTARRSSRLVVVVVVVVVVVGNVDENAIFAAADSHKM